MNLIFNCSFDILDFKLSAIINQNINVAHSESTAWIQLKSAKLIVNGNWTRVN